METQILEAVDVLLKRLETAYRVTKKKVILRLLLRVLRERHLYLDKTFYRVVYERQVKRLAALRGATMTVSQLLKLNASESQWTRWLPFERSLVVFLDEYEHLATMPMAAAIGPFHVAVIGGDRMQSPLFMEPGTVGGAPEKRRK